MGCYFYTFHKCRKHTQAHHTTHTPSTFTTTSDFFFLWLLKKRRQKRPISTQKRKAEAGLFWLLKKRRRKRPISTQKKRTEAGLLFWLWRTEADLSHEFLGGEDQFVVDEPARVFLEETGVGVHHHRLLMLHRLVLPAFPQPRRVVEIARRDRLVTAYNQNVLPLVTLCNQNVLTGDKCNQNVLPLVTPCTQKCIVSGDTVQSKCMASGDKCSQNVLTLVTNAI